MGVVINPGGAQFSYSGFHQFRINVAAAEGFDLEQMEGFGGENPWVNESGRTITVLEPFLNNSDCDGYISSWECRDMWERMRDVAPKLESPFDQDRCAAIAEGMKLCADNKCAMEFS